VSRTITDFFAKTLNAPLHNPQWVKGELKPDDKALCSGYRQQESL